ncbi:MAG: CCA tRNA nucleotidyltransferase [Chitinophagales bacterium]
MDKLNARAHEAYVVGGAVRDLIMDVQPVDYDITTSADAGEIAACFSRSFTRGDQHQTIAVSTDNGVVEVSPFRGDPGSGLNGDLDRRDFTINALAMDQDGKIYDPLGGNEDIANALVRLTGEERLKEDPLRLMRAIRFCSTLGFQMEPETEKLIIKNNSLIQKTAIERVREELNRILVSADPARGFRMLATSGLLPHIVPEVAAMVGFDQCNPRHDKDVFEHSLAVMEKTPARLKVRLAGLLHDVAKPNCYSVDEKGTGHFYGHHTVGENIARAILNRLKYDRDTVQDVSRLVGAHMSRFASLRTVGLKKLITHLGEHNLTDLYDLQWADIVGSAPPADFTTLEDMQNQIDHILKQKPPIRIENLAISGRDLISLGFSPGPSLGKALDYLLEAVLVDPELNRPEILLDLARRYLADNM